MNRAALTATLSAKYFRRGPRPKRGPAAVSVSALDHGEPVALAAGVVAIVDCVMLDQLALDQFNGERSACRHGPGSAKHDRQGTWEASRLYAGCPAAAVRSTQPAGLDFGTDRQAALASRRNGRPSIQLAAPRRTVIAPLHAGLWEKEELGSNILQVAERTQESYTVADENGPVLSWQLLHPATTFRAQRRMALVTLSLLSDATRILEMAVSVYLLPA
jgi:hypothetical protein